MRLTFLNIKKPLNSQYVMRFHKIKSPFFRQSIQDLSLLKFSDKLDKCCSVAAPRLVILRKFCSFRLLVKKNRYKNIVCSNVRYKKLQNQYALQSVFRYICKFRFYSAEWLFLDSLYRTLFDSIAKLIVVHIRKY